MPSGPAAPAPGGARRASPRASRLQRLRLVHQHDGDVVLDPVHQPARLANDLLLLFAELELALALRAGEDLLELLRDGHRGLDITKNATAPRDGRSAGTPRTPAPTPSPRPGRRRENLGAARIPARIARAAAARPPMPKREPLARAASAPTARRTAPSSAGSPGANRTCSAGSARRGGRPDLPRSASRGRCGRGRIGRPRAGTGARGDRARSRRGGARCRDSGS